MRHTTIMRDRRMLIFVDESNVVSAVRALGRKLDWLKLRDHLVKASQGRELIEIVIYAGLPPRRGRPNSRVTSRHIAIGDTCS
jgi:hypothetical protein